jgi:hypothetical protein
MGFEDMGCIHLAQFIHLSSVSILTLRIILSWVRVEGES